MLYFLAESLSSPDGASRAACDFLCALLDAGHDVVVVSRVSRGSFHRSHSHGPARLRWVVVPDAEAPVRPELGQAPRKWLSWARTTFRQRRRQLWATLMLRRFPPTAAIHNEFPYPGSFAHHVLHSAPRRLTIVHSTPECIAHYLRRRKTLTVESVGAGLSQMHGLLFVSPQLREAWAALAPIEGIPAWVLSNTCREDEAAQVLAVARADIRASLGLPDQSFIAVCVGYVHDGKGQDTLVAVLPGMVRSQPDLLVVFVGNDTSEWAAGLKRRINEASLADHVRFVGRRADPYAFIRAADLLIHPSRTEGQGLVLLEATLLRTPVLASDVGGIPSVITHGDTGWLVPPDDPAALLRGFEHLVANPRLRRELADRAEQSYWRRCSQREYSAALTLVLQAFLAPGGAQGAR